MGFLRAMKGANNVWGTIICADGVGTIGPENLIKNTNHKLMITIGFKTFTFSKSDVKTVQIIASTSEWIKYLILLKNGKSYVALFMMTAPSQNKRKSLSGSDNGKKFNLAVQNFEWWMFDLVYSNIKAVNAENVLSNNCVNETVNNEKSKVVSIESIMHKKEIAKTPQFWICKKCGSKNQSPSLFCKDCGAYK